MDWKTGLEDHTKWSILSVKLKADLKNIILLKKI